jgi:hypothetical protein
MITGPRFLSVLNIIMFLLLCNQAKSSTLGRKEVQQGTILYSKKLFNFSNKHVNLYQEFNWNFVAVWFPPRTEKEVRFETI